MKDLTDTDDDNNNGSMSVQEKKDKQSRKYLISGAKISCVYFLFNFYLYYLSQHPYDFMSDELCETIFFFVVIFVYNYIITVVAAGALGILAGETITKKEEYSRAFYESSWSLLFNTPTTFLAVKYCVLPHIIVVSLWDEINHPHIIVFQFIINLLVFDTWFYWLHRVLHTEWVYHLHKLHHSFNPQFSMAATVMDPIEQFLETVVPTVVLPFLIFQSSTMLTAFAASAFYIVIHGILVHVGTEMLFEVRWFNNTRDHFVHHKFGLKNYNYSGLFTFWDRICGTYLEHGEYLRRTRSTATTSTTPPTTTTKLRDE